MKHDHPVETAAYTVVVRSAVDELQGRHKQELTPAALKGLATVERFVAGEDVSFAELDTAREVYELKTTVRCVQWVNTAIGNLGFLASKARGWQEAGEPTINAAIYALSVARKDQSDPDTELKALYSDALARARSDAKKKPKLKAPKGVPVLQPVMASLTKALGPAANKKLLKAEGAVDAKQKGTKAALLALLKKSGLSASPALLAFDDCYGGLVFSDGGSDWLVGAHACLASQAHSVSKDSKLVPVAYSPNDVIFYLDAKGAAFAEDTIEGGEPARFAKNGDEMMQKILKSL